ncbi:MAG: HAMP domain-containing histidine kinase [Clostridia bacterium]|nr:HAMP domain-containing histidine kinase [Clostridia bacterium]
MLKRLQRRFVRLSMGIVGLILIAFYLFTMLIIWSRITDGVKNTLKNYSSDSFLSRYFDIGVEGDESNSYAIDAGSVCVVQVTPLGSVEVQNTGRAHMETEVLRESVLYVTKADHVFGSIVKYNLFFYRTENPFGYRIAFADSTRYFSYLKDLLWYGTATLVITFIVLYLVIRKLTGIFIKPVDRAWIQQQNFIADASHELKTPLTVILANCNIMLAHRGDTVENQIKWINGTNEEATHMKDMVDKMLYLAKSENMKGDLVLSDVDVSELATRLLLQFEPVAYEAGVVLESQIRENIRLKADHTMLNQVIHILTDNAIKYAGLGGTATVRLFVRRDGVYLTTHNTGPAIPPEDLPHIFERFYRSDKARTTGNGYGLGLAICKNLVEQQHATISVSSTPEAGTTFVVRFKRPKKEYLPFRSVETKRRKRK